MVVATVPHPITAKTAPLQAIQISRHTCCPIASGGLALLAASREGDQSRQNQSAA